MPKSNNKIGDFDWSCNKKTKKTLRHILKSTVQVIYVEVAIPSGIILLVSIIIAIVCVIRKQCKRPETKQEEMNADENPVYGVYQFSETYERQYSTNEAVDSNDYYAQ